ncbi:BREX-2 system adenine-specific DNA-methyltransferase PglX [Catellatospora sp. NPDC049609]|uniref:BREX-2 system adenine-specific DNA-methyltransferase PglX n=1 Tax=Catellatospora sp. NPDC049609 TaxID=3155505 RepID=UPI0034361E8F
MTAEERLTGELRVELKALEDDLRRRVATQPAVDREWRDQHREALQCGRTAGSWQEWSDDRVTQAAVAWILTTVFIRFAEDNKLIKQVWISGPKERRQEALTAQAEFLRHEARTNPDVTDREWLLRAIKYLAGMPATRELVDETSALWLVTPSGDAAARLLAFWRERNEDGELLRDLSDESLDTRFLGDLYQELSQEAQEKYALKQTPVFVEEFILDRTMKPALDERPLDSFKMIDPTCGSGHFLLGGFTRLRERWERHAPGMERRARVQKALDAIHGVDLNPFAVAIARFRLTIAAMLASGDEMLENAPAFNYHLAVGDSLLHGLDQLEIEYGAGYSVDRTAATYAYPTENLAALQKILRNGRYDVVVGNPPYKSVGDKALNRAYRDRYRYLKGQYQLTVPFMERFFDLAKTGERPGWVGKITGNGFMRREFGAPLIERFLPTKDLRLVADSSGAYIPGHGTPTVILVGRNRRPVGETVRAVMGVRGEPGRPTDPAKGLVWNSLSTYADEPGYSDEWVTVVDLDRRLLATHPWSLSGGGAVEVKEAINSAPRRVGQLVARAGMFGDSHAEDAFAAPVGSFRRFGVAEADVVLANAGDGLRDWVILTTGELLMPPGHVDRPQPSRETEKAMWPWRTSLWGRMTFSHGDYRAAGRHWLSWHQISVNDRSRDHISFVKIATHNHFAMTRSGVVEKPSTLRVELPEGATEDDHLALLGVLNSSTACFWLTSVFHE